jgi:hypothetical protein
MSVVTVTEKKVVQKPVPTGNEDIDKNFQLIHESLILLQKQMNDIVHDLVALEVKVDGFHP